MADRTTLKSYFQTGDVPSGANFAELIDSFKLSEEIEPYTMALHIGVAITLYTTTWTDIADVLIIKPPVDWQLDLLSLLASTKDVDLRLVDSHVTTIHELALTARPIDVMPFDAVNVAALQDHGSFIHLTLQARLSDPSSAGDLTLPQIIFSAHP